MSYLDCARTGGFPMENDLVDANLQILSTDIRRQLLQVLRNEITGETTLDTVVDQILSGRTPGTDRRERLRLELHHNHLPRLDEQGLVEYDASRKRIRYRSDSSIEGMLASLPSEPQKTAR